MGLFAGIVGDIPGQAVGVFTYKDALGATRDTLSNLDAEVKHSPSLAPSWEGEARDAFTSSHAEGLKQNQRLSDGFDDATHSLDTYAWVLHSTQSRADGLKDQVRSLDDAFTALPAHDRLPALPHALAQAQVLINTYTVLVEEATAAGAVCAAELRDALHLEPVNLDDGGSNIGQLRDLTQADITRILNEIDNPDHTGVVQGAIGDCYLLASLMALMNTPGATRWLEGCLQVHHGKDGKPDGFLVTIYDDPFHRTQDTQHTTLVTSTYLHGTNGSVPTIVSIFEAAYGQTHLGGTRDSFSSGGISGGWAEDALEELTGTSAAVERKGVVWGFGEGYGTTQRASIQEALTNDQPLAASTVAKLPWQDHDMGADVTIDGQTQTINISRSHVYMVVTADEDTVTLRNPWGRNYDSANHRFGGTFTMSWDEFGSKYSSVAIGDKLG